MMLKRQPEVRMRTGMRPLFAGCMPRCSRLNVWSAAVLCGAFREGEKERHPPQKHRRGLRRSKGLVILEGLAKIMLKVAPGFSPARELAP